jgi:hypothetical protein
VHHVEAFLGSWHNVVGEDLAGLGRRLVEGINGYVQLATASNCEEVVLLVVVTMSDTNSVSKGAARNGLGNLAGVP